MQVQVGALPQEDLLRQGAGEPSASIAARVAQAHERQLRRQGGNNSSLSPKDIDHHCKPDAAGEQLLLTAMTRLNWSARAYHRVLKLARTIADMADAATITSAHVAEAVQYRRALREH